MNEFILYVDDTGFNANEKDSKQLQGELTTFAGVLIHKDLEPELVKIMQGLSKLLEQSHGSSEFHFTEIYNGKNNFQGIQPKEILDILETFAQLINEFDIPIIVQTIKKDVGEGQQALNQMINMIAPHFHLPQNEKTQALITLCFRAKQFVEENFEDAKLTNVVCDEGIRKNGAEEFFPSMNIKLEFKSSADCTLLQIADFSAWFLTRVKHVLDRASKKHDISDIGEGVLQICSQLAPNYVNLSSTELDLENLQKFNYDKTYDGLTELE